MFLALMSLALLATATPPAPADSLKLTALTERANETPDHHSAAPALQVRAIRAEGAIVIDGHLNEPTWRSGEPITNFTQRDPIEGGQPSQRTEVRVAYDEDAIYIGARMFDSAPDSILSRLSRRDVVVPGDRFTVYLDPYHDRRSGYYFMVSAAGTLADGTLLNDSWDDDSWDGVWSGRASVDSLGWIAEMRIPYSQLRFQKSDHYVWGINLRRSIQRHNELDYLVYLPKNGSGFCSRFPELVGIEGVHPARAIEISPYVTTKAELLHAPPLDPFHRGSQVTPQTGGDLRMGVGSKLTLNATVNPDFGQVEVDPAVVNLSDVESYFQEKRPFFVEGSSTFSFGQQGANDYWGFNWPEPIFFYSRRVGRAPERGMPSTDDTTFTDVPTAARILGAAKLTGKLAPSWNFGTLHAVTARENADLQQGFARSRLEAEPLTYYGVNRVQKEFKERTSGIGVMTTLAARSFSDPSLKDELNSRSLMTGLDGWHFLDRNQTWVLSGWSALSRVRGSETDLSALQQSSRHYFQRPDAPHLGVDPSATAMTGYGSRVWLNKQKGKTFMNAAAGFISPGFDVGDVGYQTRSDVINGHVGGGRKWTDTTKHRKYQDVMGAAFSSFDFQGNRVWGGLWASGNTEFSNNYSWQYSVAYNPESVNNRRTRGGPLTINKPGYEASTYFDTDGKSKLFYFVNFYTYDQNGGAWQRSASPGVEWKPASNVTLRVGPGLSRVHETGQYVDQISDAAATSTFGQRYVFATLDQTEVSADIRLNWAFTPNLSLVTFIQPLVSSGKYTGYKSLARPRSYEFTPYAYGANRDFNYRSLRGNAVLRWEYMPGSTLFLVWTQSREDAVDDGTFRLGPSYRSLLDAAPDNIFLAKLTYYLNR